MQALERAGAIYARDKAIVMALRCFIGLIVILLLLLLADMLLHFTDAFRGACKLILLTVAFITIISGLIFARFYRPPITRIARLLEARDTRLGSKLINILQLNEEATKQDSSALTKQLAQYAVAQASEQLDRSALPPLAREPKMRFHTLRCVASCVIIILLTAIGGSIAHNQWLRLLDPFGDHPPFSLTILTIEVPQDPAVVIYDQGLTVEVTARGHLPSELFLTMTPDDTSKPSNTLPMMQQDETHFVCRLEHIHHPASLVAHTRDHGSRSKKRHIDIQLTPQFAETRVNFDYPEYTGLKDKSMPFSFRPIQVLAGTTLEFEIHSNRPLGKGEMLFQPSSDDTPIAFALTPVSPNHPRVANAKLTTKQSGKLTFSLVDETGIPSLERPEAAITVTRDQAPVISISKPERDALCVENFTVPLTIDARDDYGIAKTRIHIAVNGKHLPVRILSHPSPGNKSDRHQELLDLAAIGAKQGDEVTIFAEAMDYRPEAQVARTEIRRLTIVSDADYKDLLRQQADAAAIAGKYENLFRDLERAIERQQQVIDEIEQLRKESDQDPQNSKLAEALGEAVRDQLELNRDLDQLAERMKDIERKNPVYDFENELAERLKQMAGNIEESTKQNNEDVEQSLQHSAVDQAPAKQTLQEFDQAAKEHMKRLNQVEKQSDDQVTQPLEDLAKMHELMKDFSQFEQLLEQQRELAEQSKAYDKEQLTEDDRQALSDIGAKQRELAPKLQQLADKMQRDAEAAKKIAPEASEQAENMAEQLKNDAMPGLARDAASHMMKGDGSNGHEKASDLLEQMEKLMGGDQGKNQRAAMQQQLEKLLQKHGMNAEDNFRQMMMSRLFRNSGQSQPGMSSPFASGQAPPLLLGGESMSDSRIAQSLAGDGNQASPGNGNGPTAQIDRTSQADVESTYSRRTDTTSGASLLMQYERLADAYFHKLTTPQPETPSEKP